MNISAGRKYDIPILTGFKNCRFNIKTRQLPNIFYSIHRVHFFKKLTHYLNNPILFVVRQKMKHPIRLVNHILLLDKLEKIGFLGVVYTVLTTVFNNSACQNK